MTWTTRPRSDAGGLAAIVAGDGPALVLIHGVGLRAEAWNAQIDALCGRFRVIAPDLPGHGQSPPLPGTPRLADYTAAIAAALPGPSIVIGHSMGAMIALDLAVRVPDRVRGVAALNAICRRGPEAARAVRSRAAGLDGRTLPDPAPTLSRWFGDRISPERAACNRWLRSADPRGYRNAYRAFAEGDAPPDADLVALPCPALFATGADEPNSTPAMSRALAALAPQGRAEILAGAAHMMPMTHAAQVSALLADFAASCP